MSCSKKEIPHSNFIAELGTKAVHAARHVQEGVSSPRWLGFYPITGIIAERIANSIPQTASECEQLLANSQRANSCTRLRASEHFIGVSVNRTDEGCFVQVRRSASLSSPKRARPKSLADKTRRPSGSFFCCFHVVPNVFLILESAFTRIF